MNVDTLRGTCPTQAATASLVRSASVGAGTKDAARQLAERLGPDLEAVILFAAPECDLVALLEGASQHFGKSRLIGCTTAGEIDETGYAEGRILAIGLPRSLFCARILQLSADATGAGPEHLREILDLRRAMAADRPDWGQELALLLVDGISGQEDHLAVGLAAGMGQVPLIGGSAGVMGNINETKVFSGSGISPGGAALLLLRSACPVRVFRTDHFRPTERRMVVTEADPDHRLVRAINGAPAAQELARLLNVPITDMTAGLLARHPLVVRIGDQHHVRAVRDVTPEGALHFYSVIGQGLVLTLAERLDMTDHLTRTLEDLSTAAAPDLVLGCDCVMRRIEAEETQKTGAISSLLRSHRVLGFSTYGEQMGPLHVNQTLTGVAFYPPGTRPGDSRPEALP